MRLSSITTDRGQGSLAFFQAWEIYPPSECCLLWERNLTAPLPIHRSDEFRMAIPWQVARQHGPPPLRRPSPMLKITFVDVKRAVPLRLPETALGA